MPFAGRGVPDGGVLAQRGVDRTLVLGRPVLLEAGGSVADVRRAVAHDFGIAAARCFETNRLEEGMAYVKKLEAASEEVLALLDQLMAQTADMAA